MDSCGAAGKICVPWERLQDGRGCLDFRLGWSDKRWTQSFKLLLSSVIVIWTHLFYERHSSTSWNPQAVTGCCLCCNLSHPVPAFHQVTGCDHIQACHVHAPLLFTLSGFISCSITRKHELVLRKLRYALISCLTPIIFSFSFKRILFEPDPFLNAFF